MSDYFTPEELNAPPGSTSGMYTDYTYDGAKIRTWCEIGRRHGFDKLPNEKSPLWPIADGINRNPDDIARAKAWIAEGRLHPAAWTIRPQLGAQLRPGGGAVNYTV